MLLYKKLLLMTFSTTLVVHIFAPFRIFASKIYKLHIIEEDSHMAWNKDHIILLGVIQTNSRDMRNEEEM